MDEEKCTCVLTVSPSVGSSAWRPGDFASSDAYAVSLSEAHFAAFDQAIEANRQAHRILEDIDKNDFALEPIARDVAAWRHEVLHGRGFIVLKALPSDRYSEADITTIFWGWGRISAARCRRAISATAWAM